TTAGQLIQYPLSPKAGPTDIAPGPDGNIWVTEHYVAKVGRITPDGVITEYPVGGKKSSPKGIVAAADGNLWYTDLGTNRIGRITTSGDAKDFAVGGGHRQPPGIATRPAGQLRFPQP